MGMTIEEAIKHGTEQLEIFGGEHREFIECAIDTMWKYKQIMKNVEAWKADILDSWDCMANIEGVLNGSN